GVAEQADDLVAAVIPDVDLDAPLTPLLLLLHNLPATHHTFPAIALDCDSRQHAPLAVDIGTGTADLIFKEARILRHKGFLASIAGCTTHPIPAVLRDMGVHLSIDEHRFSDCIRISITSIEIGRAHV